MDRQIKTLQDKNSYLDLRKQERVTLLEILDRALAKGQLNSEYIVITGPDEDIMYLG